MFGLGKTKAISFNSGRIKAIIQFDGDVDRNFYVFYNEISRIKNFQPEDEKTARKNVLDFAKRILQLFITQEMPEINKNFSPHDIETKRIAMTCSRLENPAIYDFKDEKFFGFSFKISTLLEEYILLKITGKFQYTRIMKSIVHEYGHSLELVGGTKISKDNIPGKKISFAGNIDSRERNLKMILAELDLQFIKSKSEGLADMVRAKDAQSITIYNFDFIKMFKMLERILKGENFDYDESIWYKAGLSANVILAYKISSSKMAVYAGGISGGENEIPEFSKKHLQFSISGIQKEAYSEAARKIARMELEEWVKECDKALDHYRFACNPFKMYIFLRSKIEGMIKK